MSAHMVLVSDQFQRAVSDEFDVLACHLNQLLHIE